ncbi:NfeD family protein [Leptolyngbya ohadii]|uniref:NfeD family protein n=1 Tax=Leptolyngbya ohadii TaxID=1962290 RepID=UPI000B59D9C8|nr:NfeD family protein [Leptolyngbya ohadii]
MNFRLSIETKLLAQPVRAVVEKTIQPGWGGRVYVFGSSWKADLYDPAAQLIIPESCLVQVVAIQGITLLVIPFDAQKPEPRRIAEQFSRLFF